MNIMYTMIYYITLYYIISYHIILYHIISASSVTDGGASQLARCSKEVSNIQSIIQIVLNT